MAGNRSKFSTMPTAIRRKPARTRSAPRKPAHHRARAKTPTFVLTTAEVAWINGAQESFPSLP